MAESLTYLSDWWRWWSNPLQGMHASHRAMLPYTEAQMEQLDHLMFLELRGLLNLHDVPDQALLDHPALRSLALAEQVHCKTLYTAAAALCMDASILQTNAQTWKLTYGLEHTDEVRALVQMWGQIPLSLKPLQGTLSTRLAQQEQALLSLEQRAQLALGIHLRSRCPHFYRRWALGVPNGLVCLIDAHEKPGEDAQQALGDWLEAGIAQVHQAVTAKYPVHPIDVPIEADADEQAALDGLMRLEEFDDA
ncbi:MAG TPA: hypothetical protein VFV57_12640 [Limnobacter sp.]|nr:hypothetical protein [Limnobacter sp.]